MNNKLLQISLLHPLNRRLCSSVCTSDFFFFKSSTLAGLQILRSLRASNSGIRPNAGQRAFPKCSLKGEISDFERGRMKSEPEHWCWAEPPSTQRVTFSSVQQDLGGGKCKVVFQYHYSVMQTFYCSDGRQDSPSSA